VVGLGADLGTLWHLARPAPPATSALPDRLERFYAAQAANYDRFRERLLPGRRDLVAALAFPGGGVWVDLGGGTACTLSFLGPRLHGLGRVFVVDLTPSLLALAHARVAREGWRHVTVLEADAANVDLPEGGADVVTLCYSLTMMPNWRGSIARARALLKPGGLVGVVDFHVSTPDAAPPRRRHGPFTRRFWPWYFGRSHVHPDPAHLATLARDFAPLWIDERMMSLPYVPGSRVPYYLFIGQR
jgi:S-adenosylmethionine-diacylgycerolhomoserine-N-methlytransferase